MQRQRLERKREQLRHGQPRYSHSPRIKATVNGKPYSPTADFHSRQGTWQQEREQWLARKQQERRCGGAFVLGAVGRQCD
jgi:hypothetical protein